MPTFETTSVDTSILCSRYGYGFGGVSMIVFDDLDEEYQDRDGTEILMIS